MVRAAIVVLELFEAVPVAETQSPAAKEPTASETVLENCVVGVQLTVVWPELEFCTSMLEALSAATLPVAPVGAFGVVAAPAVAATAATATRAVVPAPRNRAQRRRFELRLVSVCISVVPLSLSILFGLISWLLGLVPSCPAPAAGSGAYSLRKASIGASEAARLAGYTPKRTPMARAMARAPTAAVGLVVMGSPIRLGR